MKLNNKGFAISSIMYIILVLAVVLISLILATLSSKKLILDKLRNEVLSTIYDVPNVTYRQTITELKNEMLSYMSTNSLEKESIKIENFDSSIDGEVLEKYKLNDKYITAIKNTDSYDVYLGKANTISNTTQLPKNTIDIVDYKIYGNSYQETSVQGKNLFDIKSVSSFYSANGTFSTSSTLEGEMIVSNRGTYGSNVYADSNIKKLKSGTYTLSADVMAAYSGFGKNVALGFGYYDSSGALKNLLEYFELTDIEKWERISYTFTISEDTEFFGFIFQAMGSSENYTSLNVKFKNIQLEKSGASTSYEEYIPNKPSIKYPSEVMSVGNLITDTSDSNNGKYKISIKTSGKNLFNPNNVETQTGQIVEYNGVECFKFTDVNDSLVYNVNDVDVNSVFTFKLYREEGFNNGCNMLYTFEDGTTRLEWHVPNQIYNLKFNKKLVKINSVANYNRPVYLDLSVTQLENGTEATDYEPPVESFATNIYLDQPLRKIEDSTDELLYSDKKIIKNVNEYVITGKESDVGAPWTYNDAYDNEIRSRILDIVGYPKKSIALSNYYPYFSTLNSHLDHVRIVSDYNSYAYVAINDTNYPREEYVDEFVQNLSDLYNSGNPVKVYYPLNNTSNITTNLPRVNVSLGATNISIDTNVKPSNFEFTVIEKIIEI